MFGCRIRSQATACFSDICQSLGIQQFNFIQREWFRVLLNKPFTKKQTKRCRSRCNNSVKFMLDDCWVSNVGPVLPTSKQQLDSHDSTNIPTRYTFYEMMLFQLLYGCTSTQQLDSPDSTNIPIRHTVYEMMLLMMDW